jgi:F0F1-type ATP synthase delta subunit
VEKQEIIDTLEEMEFANLELKEVQLIQQTPLYVSVTLLSNQTIKTQQLDEVKKRIETRLNRKIQLESKVAILR